MNAARDEGIDGGASPVSQTGGESTRRNWNIDENPERLAVLMKRSMSPSHADWSPRDLADMLAQELGHRPAKGVIKGEGGGEALAYFRQTQARAKRAIGGGDEGVHPELALGLYYVALTRAWLEEGVWISKLTHAEVAEGLRHVQRFAWVNARADLMTRLTELAQAAIK